MKLKTIIPLSTWLLTTVLIYAQQQPYKPTTKHSLDSTYNMNNQTVNDCSGTLFDSGGENGNYNKNENLTCTIKPTGAQQIKLIASSWGINDGCVVSFYDGNSISDPLIATYSSFSMPNEIYANSGVITIQLISDTAITGYGFKLDWSSIGGSCSLGTPVLGPAADFKTVIDYATSPPYLVDFTDVSAHNPVGWTWLLPGSASPRRYEKKFTEMYQSPGTYTITLIVVNEGGRDTISKTITIKEQPAKIYMFNGVVAKCKGYLYDNGGIEANYQNNIDYTLVIQPQGAKSITMNFTEWSVERNYDFLYIYNGTSTSAPLLGKWSSRSPRIVTANSGSMTLRFTSDESVTKKGWKATWKSTGGNCDSVYTLQQEKKSDPNNTIHLDDFLVWPNPATGEFMLRTNKDYEELSIVNITGTTLLQLPITGTQLKIQIPGYPAGLYLIQLRKGNDIKTQKFIIQ